MLTPTPSFVFIDEANIDEELKCRVCYDIYPLDAVCCRSCMNAFCRQCIETLQRCPLCRNDPWPLQKIPLPLRNILAKLKVECLVCSKTNMERGDFDHHVEHVCPIDCPYGCEEKTTRAKLAVHESECSKKPVQCSYAELGCAFETVRSEIDLHHSECPFLKLAPILSKQKRDYRELLNMVTTQRKRIRQLELDLERERMIKKQKTLNNAPVISPPTCTMHPRPTSITTNSAPFHSRAFSPDLRCTQPPGFPFVERGPAELSTWLTFETDIFQDLRVPPPVMIETPTKPITFLPFAQDFSPHATSFVSVDGSSGLRTNGTIRWT